MSPVEPGNLVGLPSAPLLRTQLFPLPALVTVHPGAVSVLKFSEKTVCAVKFPESSISIIIDTVARIPLIVFTVVFRLLVEKLMCLKFISINNLTMMGTPLQRMI